MFCSPSVKFHKGPLASPCSNSSMDGDPGACWTWPRKPGSSNLPPQRSTIEQVEQMHHQITQVWPLGQEHTQQTQAQQACPGERIHTSGQGNGLNPDQ